MNVFKYLISLILFYILITPSVFSQSYEEKNPRDERTVLVPKGARPVLKEEYPRGQLVVDRIKARHRYSLSIPFARAWNTAALTFLSGIQEEPDIWNNREAGFAIHNQRLRVGAVKNKEFFQKETAGFPEGRYWPMPLLENVNRSTGYISSTFIHLMFKQVRNSYSEPVHDDYVNFQSSDDRLNGMLNVMLGHNQNLNFEAQRNNQNLVVDNRTAQTRTRNSGGILYRRPGGGGNILVLKANSVWSGLTDGTQRKFDYASGTFSGELGKNVLSGFNVNAKTKFQLSKLTDRTIRKESETLESRKVAKIDLTNIASPVSFIKLKLNATGIYDSEFSPYMIPDVGVTLGPKAFQIGAGYRRKVILPEFDELYWQSKHVIVNDDLKAEDAWEAYGLLKADVITRIKLNAEVSYGSTESRIAWIQLSNHVWYPANVETSESIIGEASLEINLIGSFNIFGNYKYQHYDTPLFEPEHLANAGLSFGRPLSGTVTLGGCFWTFQPTQIAKTDIIPPFDKLKVDSKNEKITFAYLRISKPLLNRFATIFLDGRYTLERDGVIYYLGTPQAGRIITVGANVIFGGLD